MSRLDFQEYLSKAIESYTNELYESGSYKTEIEARAFAEWEFHEDIFTDGYATENTYVFNLVDSSRKVGVIWMIQEEDACFIGDFLVYPEYQKKGFGTQAIKLIEEEARELGSKSIRLGVFKNNTIAEQLYRKLGYVTYKEREKNFVLEKTL